MTRQKPSSSRRWRASIAIAVCVLHVAGLFEPALLASEHRLSGSILNIKLREGILVDASSGGQASLKERPIYLLRKGDTVTVMITDPNPLLFNYGSEEKLTETAQHKAAADAAKMFAEFVGNFRDTKAAGLGDETLTVEGLNFKLFSGNLNAVNNRIEELRGLINNTLGDEASIARAKAEVAAWNISKLTDDIKKGYQQLRNISNRCRNGQPLSAGPGVTVDCNHRVIFPAPKPSAALMPASVDTTAVSVGGPSADPLEQTPQVAPITNKPPQQPGGTPTGGATPQTVPTNTTQTTQTTAGNVTPAAPIAPADTIAAYSGFAFDVRDDVEKSLTLLKGFETDMMAVHTPRKFPRKDAEPPHFEYSIQDREVILSVTPSKKYEAYLSPEATQRQNDLKGDSTIFFKPYTPASISVAPAFVILFGKNPTYKAVKKGEAYVIEESDPQGVGYNLGAMMTITPRAWSQPTFGGQFQVGVSPTKNKLGFYAGAGIQIQQLITIGAGGTWQQVNKLASGQPNDEIASPDLLKTTTEYRPGWYIHITTSIK